MLILFAGVNINDVDMGVGGGGGLIDVRCESV